MAEIEHLVPERLKSAKEAVANDTGFGAVVRNVEKGGEAHQILEKLGEHLLQTSADDAREKGISSVQTKLLQGDPATELIHLIKSEKADAVVSGSRGLGNLRGLLIGSVSNKLSQHAPCACIMVK
jgi:nucleotide-binding universal stress UspA family protein